ncbi:protein YLS9-like isoform X1 [Cucumis melo var. makuwa]|uniref:Protein YLS9-like isoform X1 n=2 Tax=Cucumis melo TaxID=3656 RepID=A0A5D3DB78_CUCMM|nr:protein YLS9-like isoform X1 [Cucumis melo var. makuwa]TYK20877.1 protein YLS9-like isoform X1 [Cucumis melo var. makuwa]
MRSTTTQEEEASSSIVEAPKRSFYRQRHETTKRTRIIRIIGRSLLCVIIFLSVAIITCWLVVFPRTPRLMVETSKVTAHGSTNRKLNATIVFYIKSYNPNKKASIYMDSMKMIVKDYMGLPFHSAIPTFTLMPRNETVFNSTVRVNLIYPFGRPVHSDWIHLELRFSAKVRYVQI